MGAVQSYIQHHFFRQAEAIIPTDFYDVRVETAPKAAWSVMFAFSFLIYVAAVMSFAFLYSYEASKSTVETLIVPYDNTGNDGYTCQMISRVNAAYQVASTGDPALAYNLVNVMESKAQCEEALAVTSPCETPLLYFPGTVTALPTAGMSFGASALFGDSLAFVYDITSPDYPTVYNYGYTTGVLFGEVNILRAENVQTNSLAVDRDAYPIYVATDGGATAKIYRARPEEEFDQDLIEYDTGAATATVYNDNVYNIYYAVDNSFVALNVYVSPAEGTQVFNLTAGDSFVHAAVYYDGSTPTVYYWSTESATTLSIYVYQNGATSTLGYIGNRVAGIVVDGMNRMYFLIADPLAYFLMRYDPESDGTYVDAGLFDTTIDPTGFAINPSGDRIFDVSTDSSGIQDIAFLYPLSYSEDYSQANQNPEVVGILSEFGATWFTCGNKLLNDTEYTPGEVAEYPDFCPSNGLSGKVVFGSNYLFTDTDAETYAVNQSSTHCDGLYAPICNTVSALPPYSCSRTLHQGFFSCAATAVANAQFLVQLLVFFAALVLPQLAALFPAKRHHSDTTDNTGAAETVNRQGNAAAQGRDVEMTIVTEVNPMR